MASSGAVLSIGRRMCFRPEASLPASSGRWRVGAMSRFHDTIKAANGEQLLGGVEGGIPHVRVSRHWIWPSAFVRLYKSNGPVNKKRLVGKNRGASPNPPSVKVKVATSR